MWCVRMQKRRIKVIFFLLLTAGFFQARKLIRLQVCEAEQWAALAVNQRLQVIWEDDNLGACVRGDELVAIVDAHGQPIPGFELKYRSSSITGPAFPNAENWEAIVKRLFTLLRKKWRGP